ncbi:MAG: GNAT family N-acetyltransferase [Bacteroidales bacterium]|nr:GNAT family N-acetyltransferase [Bacteroidales bacterium]
MEFKNFENIDFETLFHAFQQAFADYEIHFDKEEVRSMLTRRGYNPKLSFAAIKDGEIISFTLNGTGFFNGLPTAYDTGTGTLKEYRGHGIATKIFNYSHPYLKDAGIKQYLLEVLQNNHKAIVVYRQLNFNITRQFDCFKQTIKNIVNLQNNSTDLTIQPFDLEAVRQAQTFCDFAPSWQNSIESIERAKSQLIFLGAIRNDTVVGFCIIDPTTGDLTQLAVNPEYRRMGIGSALLQRAIELMKTDFIKVLNISDDNQTLPLFLNSKNIPLATKQYEMKLRL